MFNVGLGEIVAIVLVTMLLFGPERLPEMARQAGRFLGRLRLTTQDALDLNAGLGDLAIRYGYQRFDYPIMLLIVIVLIAIGSTDLAQYTLAIDRVMSRGLLLSPDSLRLGRNPT